MFARLAVLVLAFVGGAAAGAEAPPPPPDGIVSLRVESADFSPSAGTLDIVVRVEIAEGWHINSHSPTSPELVPTVLSVEPPAGFEVGEVRYPPGESVALRFARGKALDVYRGTVRLVVPLRVGPGFGPAGVGFLARLKFQACDDTRCLRPAEVTRSFVVKSPPPGQPSPAPPAETSAVAPVADWLREYGLLPTLLFVAVLGLGLNLTPCVYPLISVTLAYFGSQGNGSRSRVLLLASAYVIGIALTFSALGVSAALSGRLFGSALQRPETLIGVALVLVALALSNFGLYSFRAPPWLLGRLAAAARGVAGAFFMGLTMGLVAAPCVGPVIVGLLVAVGSLGDPVLGFALFFALALGLGAPYLVLAVSAGALARLPRSGEWLIWVEHVFGVVLLGLALYFVSPLLPDPLVGWLVPLFLAGSGIVLGFLDPHGNGLRLFPVAKQALGIGAILAGVWSAMPSAARASIEWTPFSEEALAAARAAGRPAVVDFRADWCLPCVEMERTTFVDPEVLRRAEQFAMLQADVTAMSPENERLLDRYRVLGVPTTIFYDRSGREQRRTVGYVPAEQFVALMDEAARGSSSVASARD